MNAALARPEVLLLCFVLLFSPLAFGTVEPWSHAIAQSAALAALAIAVQHRTAAGRLRLHVAPGTLPLLLFLGFLLLQVTPLPPALLRVLSPSAHGRWAAALDNAGPLPWLTLSLDPLATVREFIRFCACAAVYFLTVQLLARRERLHAATVALPIFAAVLSFEALVQFLVAPLRLLFLRPAPALFPFGPFVNRNHYANLMAMLTPVVFGLFLGRGNRGRPRTLRERLVDLLARPESGVRLLLGFAALLSAASLVISLSRGATVAVIAALLVFGGCVIAHRLGRRRSVAAALFFYAFTVFVGWFGWEKVADRFASLRMNPDVVDTVRAGLWRDTLRICADFPLLGAGVGSFGRLYPAYRTVPGPFAVAHAHNDHLELLAGGGAVGLGLFAWFTGAVLLAAARGCFRRHDPPSLYLAFGAIAGCVAFLVHGASDFSLAIGANALYFFFLLGLAVSASHTRGPRDDQRTLLGNQRLPARVSYAVAALALAAGLGHAADLAGRRAWSRAAQEERRLEPQLAPPASIRRLVALAARLQPLEPAYPAALARIASRDGNPAEALTLTRRALRRLPVDAAALMQLGALLSARKEDEPARRSFTAAVAADPAAPMHRETFGAWLLSRGERDAAVAHLSAAMMLDPARAPGIFSRLVLAGFDDDQILAAVPSNPEALLRFARFATATGAHRLAGEAYRRTLVLDPGNRQATAGLGVPGQIR
jgi:O-antigen ligase